MGLAFRQAVTLELLYEFEELHATDVVGHTPECALGWVGDDARCLGIDQLVVIAQSSRCDLVFVILLVYFLDGRAHNAVISRHNRIF